MGTEIQSESTGKVHTKVTHDLILDVYESSLDEPDEDKREAILATCKVLSENIGTYLVDIDSKEIS